MKLWQFLVSLTIWLFIYLPVALSGIVIVPIALLTERGDGYNAKFRKIFWFWDNDTDSPHGNTGQPYLGFWRGYWWSCYRNPCSNFGKFVLGQKFSGMIVVNGDETIRDGHHAGSYTAKQSWGWEYFGALPYGIGKYYCRVRIGWKIAGAGNTNTFVFSISPLRQFN